MMEAREDVSDFVTVAEQIIKLSEFEGKPFVHLLDSDELLRYEGGVYLPVKQETIAHLTEDQEPRAKAAYCYEVFEKIKRRQPLMKRSQFDVDPDLLNLHNGIYDITTGDPRSVVEHTPEYFSLVQLPLDLDPDAKCPEIEAFLEQSLPDEESRLTVLEELASCLYPGNPWQRFYVWQGSGANGKGTLVRVMTALLGSRNVSNFSLQDLQNPFNSGNLPGKLANFGGDVGEAEVKNVALLKSITGQDRVMLTAKNVQAWESDGPLRVKFFFLANTLPVVKDKTRAFMRRGIVTEWTEEFSGDARDDKLTQKLTTPEELAGFLNLLLKTLAELRSRGDFAHAPTIEETTNIWSEKSDPVHSFVVNCLEFRIGLQTLKQDVHGAYVRFCEERHFGAKNDRAFSVALKHKFAQISAAVTEEKVHDGRVWVGVGLKGILRPADSTGRLGA